MKNKLFLSLSIMMLAAMPASATNLESLPDSTIWWGHTYYSGEENLSVRIDYAVYDRDSGEFGNYEAPGDGQYIYAYQIFTDPSTESGYLAVGSMNIPGVSTASITGIGTVDDQVADSLDAENDGSSLTWSFMSVNLVEGSNSFFLVFSSDSGPVAGTYELTAKPDIAVPGHNDEFPNPKVPEPATVLLLGLGMSPALMKRKKDKN